VGVPLSTHCNDTKLNTVENLLAPAFTENAILHRETLERLTSSSYVYAMFITPRSGSTWLTELATVDGRLGMPHEYFNYDWLGNVYPNLGYAPPSSRDIDRFVSDIAEKYRSPQGVVGVQLSSPQARMLIELSEDLCAYKDRLAFFYLRRRNVLAQAISLYRSADSGYFHSHEQDTEAQKRFDELGYLPERILFWLKKAIILERDCEALFNEYGVQPRRFYYEDIVADRSGVMEWLYTNVMAHFGRPADLRPIGQQPPWTTQKLSDDRNAEWQKRLRTEKAAEIEELERDRPALLGGIPTKDQHELPH